MDKNIVVYDTTLRDGMQAVEINFNLEDKIQISHKLDQMGIDYIEGGFPLSSEKEALYFQQMQKEKLAHSKVVAFGSTRRPGTKASSDSHVQALLEAETPAVTVVGKTWKAHVEKVLKTSHKENLAMIYDSIGYLKKEGREVFFDLEHFFDGYKDDQSYAVEVLRAGSDAGADCLVLCDTNGGTLPEEIRSILEALPVDTLAPIGAHFHNDCGTAVANSLVAVEYGAVHVQGTINGWGERTGNANLCVIIPNLALKMKKNLHAGSHLKKLTSLSRFVSEKANIIHDKRQPYVGDASFSHKAGQHADVVAKAAYLMEHIDSGLVGNERKILLSELAGKSTIVNKISKYGDFDKKSKVVIELSKKLKQKEIDGYEYEAAEASFDILIRKALGKYKPLFELNNYHLESYKTFGADSKTVARIIIRSEDKQIMGAAVGTGPVETLDGAVRDALTAHYEFLHDISLTDFKVRVLNPERAAAAKVRVFITSTDHHGRSWDTVGVHENIVEASWQALVDSLEYYYNNFALK
jgi:2-isopropylmalate synthase